MGRSYIPSSKPAIFRTSTQSSKPSSRCANIRPFEIPLAVNCVSIQQFVRRVMRAWWSSRSSKPLPRHFVPGGRFDSYPLRQSFLSLDSILNSSKGGDRACRATQILKLTALSSCAG